MNEEQKNEVTLCGELTYTGSAYDIFGETFHACTLATKRLSGTTDCLKVSLPDVICVGDGRSGRKTIKGSLRSRNVVVNGRSHLELFVHAAEVSETDVANDRNEIELTGYICRLPVFRITPGERQIADLLIAVNRVNRDRHRADYIPAIAWGRNAQFVRNLAVGTKINVKGRIQSREYAKRLEDGTTEIRTAYEVSVAYVSIVADKESNADD